MRTEDYLKDLSKQKALLVSALNTNGVVAKDNETFDTLVPKVNQIIGKKIKMGIITPTEVTQAITITDVEFEPKKILLYSAATQSVTISSAADTKKYLILWACDKDITYVASTSWQVVASYRSWNSSLVTPKATSGGVRFGTDVTSSYASNSLTIDFSLLAAGSNLYFADKDIYYVLVAD